MSKTDLSTLVMSLPPPPPLLQVSRLAGVLVKNGVRTGDLVVIYMPMIPQAMFAMLACARIGAPHSLIFGGFASKELSVRINHAKVREKAQGCVTIYARFIVPCSQGNYTTTADSFPPPVSKL